MEWLQQHVNEAFAVLAGIDPLIMRAILSTASGLAFLFGVYWLVKRIQKVKFIRHWGEARQMKRKRRIIVDEFFSDAIEEAVSNMQTRNKITEDEGQELRERAARGLRLPDLLPKKSVDIIKSSIRERLWGKLSAMYKQINIPGPKPGEQEEAARKSNKVTVYTA